MVNLLELPLELLEPIFSFVRPAGVPLKLQVLHALARLRLVHRVFAQLLPTHSILSAIHLEVRRDSKAAVMQRTHHLAHCFPKLPVSQLVIHSFEKIRTAWDLVPDVQLETPFVRGCTQVHECTFFSFRKGEPLRSITSLVALRRLAINCDYTYFLRPIMAELRSLDTLVLYPVHTPGQPCGWRTNPSCVEDRIHRPDPDYTRGEPPWVLTNLHLEAANASCMHRAITLLRVQPAYLYLNMDAGHSLVGAITMAEAVIDHQRLEMLNELSIAGLQVLEDGQEARAILESAAVEHGFTMREQEHSNLPSWVTLPCHLDCSPVHLDKQ